MLITKIKVIIYFQLSCEVLCKNERIFHLLLLFIARESCKNLLSFNVSRRIGAVFVVNICHGWSSSIYFLIKKCAFSTSFLVLKMKSPVVGGNFALSISSLESIDNLKRVSISSGDTFFTHIHGLGKKRDALF